MDPLVRAALGLQQLVVRGAGLILSGALGIYLICYAADPPPESLNMAALAVWGCATGWQLLGRLRALGTEGEARRDLQLFMNLVTGVYAAVLHLPGALTGPFYPAVYVAMMVTAAFARPIAAVLSVVYALLLEAG